MAKKIGIICAMQLEAELLKGAMQDMKEETISGVTYSSGTIGGTDCVVAVCGIGKVFAALCAQTMILRYQPDAVVNSGVAGALDPSLRIGDIVVAESVCQHDMDTSPIGDPLGMLSGINIIYIPCDEELSAAIAKTAEGEGAHCVKGRVSTGDQFIATKEQKDRIISIFNGSACEMEGGSIGQVCYVNKVPFAVLRAISDGGDENSTMDFPTFAKMAAERASKIMIKYLSSLS